MILRQQMKMFVIAAGFFAVVMYLVYGYSFPIDGDQENGSLFDLYNTMMIYMAISGLLVIFQTVSGTKRIELMFPEYGRACKM